MFECLGFLVNVRLCVCVFEKKLIATGKDKMKMKEVWRSMQILVVLLIFGGNLDLVTSQVSYTFECYVTKLTL